MPFIRFFFLQRYDLFPAVVSLAAILLVCGERYVLAGLMVSLGAGMKLYPALFAPPLFVLAWRDGKTKPFCVGLIVGAVPLLVSSFWLPWWRFLSFHSHRGLQAESLWASVVWLSHLLGWTDARWEGANRCAEVHGGLASTILPWARIIWVGAVAMSAILAGRAAFHMRVRSAPEHARLLLVPLLAFVTFNQVFSPQFMIWLLPLAAFASLADRPLASAAIPIATTLIPGFFPTPEYYQASGINLCETLILVGRNLILVFAWVVMVRELLRDSTRGLIISKRRGSKAEQCLEWKPD